ncbi:hypothetical protein ACH4Q7_22820 [Streptomyces roseolus]|uniref:hypothetical protein n=1 Tax=Streptomyces roseolus TaxID=67358 RepID=UPI0037ADB273
MFERQVHPEWEDLEEIPLVDGGILKGRLLVHYLWPGRREDFSQGIERKMWVTTTAYSAEDASPYLRLPFPDVLRRSVILIDPLKVRGLRGPKHVARGGGIEFLLPFGAPAEAIMEGMEVKIW